MTWQRYRVISYAMVRHGVFWGEGPLKVPNFLISKAYRRTKPLALSWLVLYNTRKEAKQHVNLEQFMFLC